MKNLDSFIKSLRNNFNKKFKLNLTNNEKEINLDGKSLDDNGLKYLCTFFDFKNLEVVNLKGNKINNIESVKDLRSFKLQKIDLNENQIEDFKPLENLEAKNLDI